MGHLIDGSPIAILCKLQTNADHPRRVHCAPYCDGVED